MDGVRCVYRGSKQRCGSIVHIGCGPLPVTVTTRIMTFLAGDPYKPSFPTVTGRGPHPMYMSITHLSDNRLVDSCLFIWWFCDLQWIFKWTNVKYVLSSYMLKQQIAYWLVVNHFDSGNSGEAMAVQWTMVNYGTTFFGPVIFEFSLGLSFFKCHESNQIQSPFESNETNLRGTKPVCDRTPPGIFGALLRQGNLQIFNNIEATQNGWWIRRKGSWIEDIKLHAPKVSVMRQFSGFRPIFLLLSWSN